MFMHTVEKLEKVPVAQAAIVLRALLADRYPSLLTEDFQLLPHYGMAAARIFIEWCHRALPIFQYFYDTPPDRVGHSFQ